MTDVSGATRTPAKILFVTFLPDGALLLELIIDWYTVLATAESGVEDTGGISRILTSWASSPSLEARSRRFSGTSLIRVHSAELERDYSRGLAIRFVGAEPRNRSAMGGFHGDERLFTEAFGSFASADPGSVESFVVRLGREMHAFFRRAQAKGQQRLAGGAYLAVLSGYLDQLRAMRSDQTAYRRVEHTIAAIIEDERYLRLAEDERARELVAAIDNELDFLYGRCMDLERGGQVLR